MVGVFMGISLPFTRHCTGFSPARQPGLEDVLQGKLFGLVEQGDLGHEPGVGGGVLPGLLAGEELEHLLKTGIDLIGVGMAQEDVQVAVPGLPLCEGLLCENAGLLPVPGLRPGLRLLPVLSLHDPVSLLCGYSHIHVPRPDSRYSGAHRMKTEHEE